MEGVHESHHRLTGFTRDTERKEMCIIDRALGEIVDFLHNPSKYAEIGATLPKGALLVLSLIHI